MIRFDTAVALARMLADPDCFMGDHRPQWLLALDCADLPTEFYYRFLYELHQRHGGFDAIEIGTLYGTSAAHLAAGNTGHVITIDIDPSSKVKCDAFGLPNLDALTGNSAALAAELIFPSVDVLYVDGHHDFGNAYTEYVGYRDLVRDGGIMIFDDIHFPMNGDEMNVFWDLVAEPKADVSWLHTRVGTGYGIVQKVNAHTPRTFEQALEIAAPIIASRRLT